jgi:transcription antitermination factor NusB
MTARQIARELAVIVLPQISKDKTKLEQAELNWLIGKSVNVLCDYAKQNLAEADYLLKQSNTEIVDIEIEHPANDRDEELAPVMLSSAQLKAQITTLQRAINLVAEALDVPALALQVGSAELKFNCKNCHHSNEVTYRQESESDVTGFLQRLILTYREHHTEIDQFIRHAKAKWKLDRMVSIDRDILRLACTEAFFMPDIPISVSINEAVDLCHRFADDKAAKFINGILADLTQEARYFRNKGVFMDRSLQPTDESSLVQNERNLPANETVMASVADQDDL